MKKFLLALMGAAACLTASATDYELVTSAADLVAGDNYLIVGTKDGNTYAMGTAKTNNFSSVSVTLNGTTITIGEENVVPVTLRTTTDATYPYQFEIAGTTPKYLYAASTSSNYMKATENASTSTSFASITVAETGVATVKFNQTTKNLLRFNSSNNPPIFSIYASGQSDVYLYKEVTVAATVEKPEFSVNSGNFTEAFNVTISCATEGAEIRYTTDGNEPTATSTLYTAGSEIAVSATTTLKAIALKGDASSAVATAVYNFIAKYTSMADLLQGVEMPENNQSSAPFVVGFEPVVTYVNGGNVYFSDNGTSGLMFKYDTGLNAGDKIKSGWTGHLKNYNGLPELEPETAVAANGTADVPAPAAFNGMDGLALNSIVKIEGVTFADATPGSDASDRNFTGEWGNTNLPFYNQFKVASVEAGKYTVLATVGCYKTTVQLQPISYEVYEEPASTVYYVLPLKDMNVEDNNEETAFIPTTFYPWYQCAGAPASQQTYNDLNNANVYTFTAADAIGPEAASGGWLSSGVDLSPILTKDYDLLFSVKTTSLASMAVKLVVEGQEDKGNEEQFTALSNGEWQTVRMNLKDRFPNFANSGMTTENAYVFAFVVGAGLQAGDTFEIANVCYVPAGTTPADPEPEPEPIVCPEKFYMIGNIDGKSFAANDGIEMTKDGSTFTYSGSVTGAGYFGFTSVLGADGNDWDTLNDNRWGGADGTEVAVDTPFTLEKATGSLKMTPGDYDFTVVFGEESVVLSVAPAATPKPVEVPERLYVIGNFAGNGWNPATAVEMTKEENIFTAIGEVSGDCNFGFGSVLGTDSNDWSTFNANRYGQVINNDVVNLDTPVALVKGEGAIRLAEAGTYKLTVVFAETGITFTASVATGIDGVDAAAEAPAEYYNLQGVRVENPAEGLYIVVRGGKATKEYVK